MNASMCTTGFTASVFALAPSKRNCSAGTFGNYITSKIGSNALISGSYTSSAPGIAAGAAIGGLFGPPEAFAGGIIGSMFGLGGSLSYVPSTGSLYSGGVAVVGAGYNGGSGISVSAVFAGSSQNPNAIANGRSSSVAFQPDSMFGSTATKSPGSGPSAIGPSVGSRSKVSGSFGYSICIRHCGC